MTPTFDPKIPVQVHIRTGKLQTTRNLTLTCASDIKNITLIISSDWMHISNVFVLIYL
jgi:hypothetical protein